MVSFFKKKTAPHCMLGAPVRGRTVALSEVRDPTFGEGILGQGVAVIPENGRICAPADGKVEMVFDTLHAVSLVSKEGAEILVHVGLDTVSLKGAGFRAHVKSGDKVKKGELMLTVDLEKVKAAGFDVITPMIVCNTDAFASVEGLAGREVNPGDDAVQIKFK